MFRTAVLCTVLSLQTLVYGGDYYTLNAEQCRCLRHRVDVELRLNPAYVWGAAGLTPGVPGDCSGKLYAIFFSCGVPVSRTTAANMGQGRDGWHFRPAGITDNIGMSLVHMTTQKARRDGHVGLGLYSAVDGAIPLVHASSRFGFCLTLLSPDALVRLKAHTKTLSEDRSCGY